MKDNEYIDSLFGDFVSHAPPSGIPLIHQQTRRHHHHQQQQLFCNVYNLKQSSYNNNNNKVGMLYENCNSPVSGLSLHSGGDGSSSSSLSGDLHKTNRNTNEFGEQTEPASSCDTLDLSKMDIKDERENFITSNGHVKNNDPYGDDYMTLFDDDPYYGFFYSNERVSTDLFSMEHPRRLAPVMGTFRQSNNFPVGWTQEVATSPSNFSYYPYSGTGMYSCSTWKQKLENRIEENSRNEKTLPCDERLRNMLFQQQGFLDCNEHSGDLQIPNNFYGTTRPIVSNAKVYWNGNVVDAPSSPDSMKPRRSGTTFSSRWNPRYAEGFRGEAGLGFQESNLNSVKNKRGTREGKKLYINGKCSTVLVGALSNSRRNNPFVVDCKSSHNSKMYNTLKDAQGRICYLAKDQNGCRFLQRKFDEGDRQEIQIIFDEIIHNVNELMVNPFGNYLIQRLLDVCTEQQRMHILVKITRQRNQLFRISLNAHGTRAVQKLIETLKTREQINHVISALEPRFLDLIKDTNGNHVIQKCLQCLSTDDNKFIFDAAARFCTEIAVDRHGCCVLQKCITYATGGSREKLVAEICVNGLFLAQDAFGNYVIQFILELKLPFASAILHSQFERNYAHLSLQKFSSNVVQKCLQNFTEEYRTKIILELLSSPSQFEQLLQDPYANYVIQTALDVVKGTLRDKLFGTIRPHVATLKMIPYCKRIYSKVLSKK
ncbi:hypothetical protein MKW98_001276 [Papaver atlanticum]|uniref:PUM-HD domain-containing protein n=1 Tax=Papaver atlanticum TaxID=357466 RepID=A0AAD4SRS0_9MAGN|nr:hypothetical protein MKW98_001276 [Papaver atlanticum]